MAEIKTFETTYTRYPFAPLVELGIVIAAWLKDSFGEGHKAAKGGHRGSAVGHAA